MKESTAKSLNILSNLPLTVIYTTLLLFVSCQDKFITEVKSLNCSSDICYN